MRIFFILLTLFCIHPIVPAAIKAIIDLTRAIKTHTFTEEKLNDILSQQCLSKEQLGQVLKNAAELDDIRAVRLLIGYNANIHWEYEAALCITCKNGHADIVQLLLEHGANPHIRSDEPLLASFNRKHIMVIKILLDWSRRPNVEAYSIKIITDMKEVAGGRQGYEEIVALLNDYLKYLHTIEAQR